MLQPKQRQQQQQQRFPSITKPHRLKLLNDVTQQPYQIGMVRYYPPNTNRPFKTGSGTDDEDSDFHDPDPGADVVERNRKERQQRIADHTKEELDKVLRRVDHAMNNYEYSVQSSLLQHGMTRDELNSIEHVADVRELENLLNDSLAKQRYKQRLMVFIVGQTEQASEKLKLLQQLGQFFVDQRQNFSGAEFNDIDDSGEVRDEIEETLKSFDAKDCYLHVKALINRINELNEDIFQFLIQNTGTKQTKVMVERGKRKLAQVTKEAKEQLAELHSKIEMTNTDISAKEEKIQTLEKDIETVRGEVKSSQETQKKLQDDLKRREAEVKFYKRKNSEYEEVFNRYKHQLGDLSGLLSFTSQSETDDGDDASKINLETIDENESKLDKDSISSRTGKDPAQSTAVPAATTDPAAANNALKANAGQLSDRDLKKAKAREKRKRASNRSKKEAKNEPGADDPSEMYRRSQELLESLLADKSEGATDLNGLFKPTRGVDLNNVTIDNLPTAFTNLRKFAIARVKDLVKELETKESANKETLQILKQEFIEHKTKYEKERLVYFLSLNPDDSNWQEEQDALAEKADNAHKLQLKAQKTAEDALNHLELFMVEQEKLDQEDVARQTDLVQRHSVVVNNVTGANITPPGHVDTLEDGVTERLSPNPKRSTPSKSQWQKLSSLDMTPHKGEAGDESKAVIQETVQHLSSSQRKASLARQSQRADSIEQRQPRTPPTPSLRKTTQELLRKKSSLEHPQQTQKDRSPSLSRGISTNMNDEFIPLSKAATPQQFDRTPPTYASPLTRSNSINRANKDHDKSSSGDRSHYNSAAQSRRVSVGLNRSPVRAEELERVLTELVSEEIEALQDFRQKSIKSRTSLREKYMSLLEEKKHELDDLKQQADITLSRPTTSTRERKPFDSLDNSRGLVKQHSTGSLLDTSGHIAHQSNKENRAAMTKHDQQQQTSIAGSRVPSAHGEKPTTDVPPAVQSDHYKVPFFHLYETIYKFRHSITSLLEQNQFLSLADRLDMIQQLSTSDHNLTNDFVDNSERVLKDTLKVLQTCMTTLTLAKSETETASKVTKTDDETKPTVTSPDESVTTVKFSTLDTDQSSVIQQKDAIIDDLNNRYHEVAQKLDEATKKHEEDMGNNERIMGDQQKLIQNLQRELMRLQKRLSKVESEGIVQPSIMFTRLDAERNDKALKQAVDKGKVSETTYNEVNEAMEDYARIPSQQFSNIVKRYIQHRKATELRDRIQSEPLDHETKSVMERMGSFYERSSGKISERISSIRQHRATLAKDLTEKFDNLEHESSLFLVRPIYSYQGRSAVQAYMLNEQRRHESLLKTTEKKKKSQHSRQSVSTSDPRTEGNSRQMATTTTSSSSASDDEERLFSIEKSRELPRPTPASQQSSQHADLTVEGLHADNKQKLTQLSEIPRLQEFDIQRTLMPMSHASVSLSAANGNNVIDPTAPAINLRSYVTLARPGAGGSTIEGKANETIHPVSRTDLSTLSVTSQITNPRTPFNSTVGDLRRISPPLPPIKRSLTSSVSPPIDEGHSDEFIPSVSINEFASADHMAPEEKNDDQ